MMVALTDEDAEITVAGKFTVTFLKKAYGWADDKEHFFNNFFDKLAGTKELKKQIQQNWSVEDIESSWQKDIDAFKTIRKKYLLYKDF